MSALMARRRLKNLLLFIPNMVLLCARLLTDPRVPTTERALLAGAIVYAIIPFDLIPDLFESQDPIFRLGTWAELRLRVVQFPRFDKRIVRSTHNYGKKTKRRQQFRCSHLSQHFMA